MHDAALPRAPAQSPNAWRNLRLDGKCQTARYAAIQWTVTNPWLAEQKSKV